MAAAVALLAVAGWSSTPHAATVIQLNIVSLAPKGTPWSDMLDEIERRIETNSAGRIAVTIRPPGMLSELDMAKETRSGERYQGCGVTLASLAQAADLPLLQLVELPFLFP